MSHLSGSNITYPADYAPNGTAPGDPGPQKLDPGVSTNRTWWKFWKLDHGSWPPRSNTTSSTSASGTAILKTGSSGASVSLRGAVAFGYSPVPEAVSRLIVDSTACLQSTLVLPVPGLVLPPVHPLRVAGGAPGDPRGPWLPTVGTDRPGGVRAADTDYFQREVRGRGLNRRPHDLVVVLETGVARLQLDPERRSCIDRHGLWVHSNRVLGATTRRVRELVERAEQVHLCRNSECQGGPGVHCACFAAVDAESLVDLGAYDRLTA